MPTPSGAPTAPLPGETTSPTGTDTVVYKVDGDGRAINITYVDTGGVMQTEFNVMLPWSKEVSLSSPARGSASVAVVNVGRDVTCSVSVNGVQVRQRSGRGLTICTGAA
ncbi:MmpS family transport accessory protein [Mycobacterium sp. DL592]|uniref:MmpS family transport accessory protein n=1 Tax=Mycobacterium sp. DL592 TaxID=2675524 RepID=UPI00352E2647